MEKLKILYEDKNIIVVNKKEGLLTISTENEKTNTLYRKVSDYVKKKHKKNKIYVVHRLDKDTSGLVLFAKDIKTKKELQDNWDKTIRKYYSIVNGKIDKAGSIKCYLRETSTYKTYITNNKKIGKYSETDYKPIICTNKYTLLDINIKTGRKNQIRVSLSSIKHPVLGDKKYGNDLKNQQRLYLHAYYLEFIHPINKEKIIIEDMVPDSFMKIVKSQ